MTHYNSHYCLANALRILSIEMVEEAHSGHPGMPMGFADVATILFQYFLKFHPKKPEWPDRDRLILSAGHGSALLYSLLYLTGYNGYNISDLKNFRKIGSITPGHPEYNVSLGIETTTGPLGQGLANAVGMAISEKKLKAHLGGAINHKIYVIVGDGCLMEGISHEAMSLAGHLGLNNLIVLFDDNKISIDGNTDLVISDNTLTRIESYNWNVESVDGHRPDDIKKTLTLAQKTSKPTFISFRTRIGYGSPNFENSELSHSGYLGKEEISLIKKNFEWNYPPFQTPFRVLKAWRNFYKRNLPQYTHWFQFHQKKYKKYKTSFRNNECINAINQLKKSLKTFNKMEASRESSNKLIDLITSECPNYIGGSADLSVSNRTKCRSHRSISRSDFSGNYIHYGVREHAMIAIMNGINIHDGFRSFAGTFLVFSDYCRPSMRLAALMKIPIVIIFTHDSIGVGEDGPTHQPVEHLSSLRAIPNLKLYRPADAIETAECWEKIIKETKSPSVLCLSRQKIPQLRNKAGIQSCKKNFVSLGAYILYKSKYPIRVSIFSSGSEVSIALNVMENLEKNGIGSRVISVPCHEIFWKQNTEYKIDILNSEILKVAIEAGCDQSWAKIISPNGLFFGVNEFGKSGHHKDLYDYFGLNVKNITNKILEIVN